jgi:hypothetical protein
MSHIVEIQTLVRDAAAVAAACGRLGLSPPVERTVQLLEKAVPGLAFQLPDWRFPVVCDLASGTLRYDNYHGIWGEQVHLDLFLQAYAAEKTKLEARRQGHTVIEQPLADGSLRLTIQVAGDVR